MSDVSAEARKARLGLFKGREAKQAPNIGLTSFIHHEKGTPSDVIRQLPGADRIALQIIFKLEHSAYQ